MIDIGLVEEVELDDAVPVVRAAGVEAHLQVLIVDLDMLEAPLQVVEEADPARLRAHLCAQEVEDLGPDVEAFAEASDAEAHRLRGRLHLERAQLARWTSLSPGERKRWQVGAALASRPHALLLDEFEPRILLSASPLAPIAEPDAPCAGDCGSTDETIAEQADLEQSDGRQSAVRDESTDGGELLAKFLRASPSRSSHETPD